MTQQSSLLLALQREQKLHIARRRLKHTAPPFMLHVLVGTCTVVHLPSWPRNAREWHVLDVMQLHGCGLQLHQ